MTEQLRGREWLEHCRAYVRQNAPAIVEAVLALGDYRLDLYSDFSGAVIDIDNDEMLADFDATQLVAVLEKYRQPEVL